MSGELRFGSSMSDARLLGCYVCRKNATTLVLAHPDTTFELAPLVLALCDTHADANAGSRLLPVPRPGGGSTEQ